jgi:hypothetical protein
VSADALTRLGPEATAALTSDWAHLLRIVADHQPAAVAVPATLYLAADNPSGYPQALIESWQGLCGELRTEHVAGDHVGVLRGPAAAIIAGNLAHRVSGDADRVPSIADRAGHDRVVAP